MAKARIALIPAYQPTGDLITLLEEISSFDFYAVVINDGSSEEYDEIFIKASDYAVILSHSENKGKGAALKTGLKYIETHFGSDCFVVTMDADGQHTPSDALRVIKDAEEHPYDLIIGSRALSKDVPLRSRFGNTVTRFVYRLATGVSIRDTQTGLRAFSGELIPKVIGIPGERYEYEMNVLLFLPEMGISIVEREINTIYIDGNSSSHFDSVRDSAKIYREILKFVTGRKKRQQKESTDYE
ncbi:MAG: glycosyltransferase family 2 protein [Oscillospiraceae bacterium]|nr:glycosyltransferase family 2 protein [Oscillospiraceae bacterium]